MNTTISNLLGNCCPETDARALAERCLEINRRAEGLRLFSGGRTAQNVGAPPAEDRPGQFTSWRIAPEPFCISRDTHAFLQGLGQHLLSFYRAANKLYLDSVKGHQPAWVAAYLDQGKPEGLIDYARMNRFKHQLPLVIRPDIIVTDAGQAVACELDSVPGGIGMTAAMNREYERYGFRVIGGGDAMVRAFAAMIREAARQDAPRLAVVISRESDDYWEEMVYLGECLRELGMAVNVVRPEDLRYGDSGFTVEQDGQLLQVDVIYRFFELFDLKNIPKTELIQYAAKKQQVVVTPPFKPYLEEKLLFALFHHPLLQDFWEGELGEATYGILVSLFPRTWILDPRPLPPHATISGLRVKGRPVGDWSALIPTTKKEREFVVKPSGFSELAWGSRGLAFGQDTPAEEWPVVLNRALESFSRTPYLLQEFHKAAKLTARYYDFRRQEIREMEGRTRLCPYYFVTEGRAELTGILATTCPADKKAIHGMVDSIMVPCMGEG